MGDELAGDFNTYAFIISIGVGLSALLEYTALFAKHRGFIHSIPFLLMYGIVVSLVSANVYMGLLAFVGGYSHMLADGLFFKLK